MLVLVITLVPIVKAETYTAKNDIIIDTKYYEFFKYQFGEDNNYRFFAYDCAYSNYNRTCYYGIDKKNNFVKIDYSNSGNSYQINITKGIDNNFKVNGTNVIEIKPSYISILTYGIAFLFIIWIVLALFRY